MRAKRGLTVLDYERRGIGLTDAILDFKSRRLEKFYFLENFCFITIGINAGASIKYLRYILLGS